MNDKTQKQRFIDKAKERGKEFLLPYASPSMVPVNKWKSINRPDDQAFCIRLKEK